MDELQDSISLLVEKKVCGQATEYELSLLTELADFFPTLREFLDHLEDPNLLFFDTDEMSKQELAHCEKIMWQRIRQLN